MPTPIRRRFAVDTLLNDKVATVDVLNRAGLVTTNDLFSGERYRLLTPDSYTDEVDAVTFPVEYKWLQTHFSQEGGAPADVAVIYWNKTGATTPATAGKLTGGVLSSGEQSLANFTGITDGAMSLTIDGTPKAISAVDLSGVTSMADVAAKINSKTTPEATVSWAAGTAQFIVTSATTGSTSTVTITGADTPLSLAMKLAASAGSASTPGTSATIGESFPDAMDDFYARGGNAYFYAYAGVNAAAIAGQQTIAAWVQSSTENKAQAMFMTTDPNAALNTATSDLGYQLRNTSMERSSVIYHPAKVVNGVDLTGHRPDAAILGRMLWTDPGAQQWDYKTLTTASDSGLSPTEQGNLRAKGYNFVETFTNTTFTHLFKGRTCTDREIRIQWAADWMDNNMQASLANYAFRTPLMAFDDETFADVEAIIRDWLDRAVARRAILEDYTVSLPDPDTIPASVRKSGQATFNDVYQATMNSAIDGWVIRGTWSIGGV